MIYRGLSQTEDAAASQLPGLPEALARSDENAKRALLAYLFLAMGQNPAPPQSEGQAEKGSTLDGRLLQIFDELFMERSGSMGEYSLAKGYDDFADDRDAVIRICDACLDQAADNDERYEMAVEAIRDTYTGRFSHKDFSAAFNSGFFRSAVDREIGSMGPLLFNLILAGMRENIYEGDRRKLVRFVVRFTKRDKASLAELEKLAGNILALDKLAAEVKENEATDTYEHVSTRLAEFQADEMVLKQHLEKLLHRDLFAEREEEEQAEGAAAPEPEDASPGQRIADSVAYGICTAIETIADIVCAPFEWLTEKINGI